MSVFNLSQNNAARRLLNLMDGVPIYGRLNKKAELMEALRIKRLKPSLNMKLGHSQGAKSLLHVFH